MDYPQALQVCMPFCRKNTARQFLVSQLKGPKDLSLVQFSQPPNIQFNLLSILLCVQVGAWDCHCNFPTLVATNKVMSDNSNLYVQ